MMRREPDAPFTILILVAPHFNMAATMAFIDPFRAVNYLTGRARFRWRLVSAAGGRCPASNGMAVETEALADGALPDMAVVSTSWSPEAATGRGVLAALRRWARGGVTLAALDTGAFVLAEAGLLQGRRATVHYEHIDAFGEMYPETEISEELFVFDGPRVTCAGGVAAGDVALNILRGLEGDARANAAARYVFHGAVRPPGSSQNAGATEPLGLTAPGHVRRAIAVMEQHLEQPLSVAAICAAAGISHRQLDRLFADHVGCTPAAYYRDIRLDRARGLVTQTELALGEVALACGFQSAVHFSRAYKARFGLTPSRDRIEGRVPFEFRAWPMHSVANLDKSAADSA